MPITNITFDPDSLNIINENDYAVLIVDFVYLEGETGIPETGETIVTIGNTSLNDINLNNSGELEFYLEEEEE